MDGCELNRRDSKLSLSDDMVESTQQSGHITPASMEEGQTKEVDVRFHAS